MSASVHHQEGSGFRDIFHTPRIDACSAAKTLENPVFKPIISFALDNFKNASFLRPCPYEGVRSLHSTLMAAVNIY